VSAIGQWNSGGENKVWLLCKKPNSPMSVGNKF
jgi:hypothetical protein